LLPDLNGGGYDDWRAVSAITCRRDFAWVVLYGSPAGLVAAGSQQWFQGILTGLADQFEPGDQFGSSLAAGDFDRDGHDDLAIGVPMEDLEDVPGIPATIPDAGVVHILYGAAGGLTGDGDQLWIRRDQRPRRPGTGLRQVRSALAAGDFDSRLCDLAVGCRRRLHGSSSGVNVLYP
jgi:hypothetical protein